MPFSVRSNFNIRDFAMRRIFRIYPLLLAAFATLWLIQATGLTQHHDALDASGGTWLANILLINDFTHAPALLGVTWTLIIEFGWYGLFAALWLWRRENAVRLAMKVAPAVMLGIALISLAIGVRAPIGRIGLFYVALLGAQSCLYFTQGLRAREYYTGCALFFVTTTFANWVGFGHFHHPQITMLQSMLPWIAAPLLFIAVAQAAKRGPIRLLAGPVATLGATSYSIYLLHPIAMALLSGEPQNAVTLVATWVLSIALALAAYHGVEKPGIALGKRLIRRRERQNPAIIMPMA
jgi:peptidoglycan/LPS O-acetylase OafA/YrhL